MKQIKFRAWDTIDKQMRYFDLMDIHCCKWHFSKWKDSEGTACELDDKVRYPDELMMFTGLKDKTGKEIYEGDVCRNGDWEADALGWAERVEKVVYEEEEGSFRGWNPCEQGLKCEVIGNIHENPELMESK